MKKKQMYSILYKWFMRKTQNTGVRRVAEHPFAIGSDIGITREQNQDRVAVLRGKVGLSPEFTILALCDGMGGMEDGASCASETIAEFFSSCVENHTLPSSERLTKAVNAANQLVFSKHHQRGGSTISALLIESDGSITGVNVGDSRIYCLSDQRLSQLSLDDTIAGQLSLILNKKVNEQQTQLVQFVGIGVEIEPHIIIIDKKAERLLLTSDGTHCLSDELMLKLVMFASESVVGVKHMIDVARWCGGSDNASVTIAIPARIRSDNEMDVNTIEVWDSFGDLRVVLPLEIEFELQVTKKQSVTLLPIKKDKKQTTKRGGKKKNASSSSMLGKSAQNTLNPPQTLLVSLEDNNNKVSPNA